MHNTGPHRGNNGLNGVFYTDLHHNHNQKANKGGEFRNQDIENMMRSKQERPFRGYCGASRHLRWPVLGGGLLRSFNIILML
jgi:hypothetical protein